MNMSMVNRYKAKYINSLMLTPVNRLTDKPIDTADVLLSKQLDDGSFVDVEFNSNSERNDFVKLHLIRMRNLAWHYKKENNQLYLGAVINGLKWWRKNVFISNNWWENLVVTPRLFVQILFMVGNEMPTDLTAWIEESIAKTMNHERHEKDIGANTIMLGFNKFLYAIYKEDKILLRECRQRLCEELNFADEHSDISKKWRSNHWKSYVKVDFKNEVYEGVQRDFSFFEHGPMLYTGGYGNIYLNEFSRLIRIVNGTDFFNKENIDFLVDYLLEHVIWTLNGRRYDFNVGGRFIAYSKDSNNTPNPITSAYSTVFDTMENLLETNIEYRKSEIVSAYNKLINNASLVKGSKYFEKGQYYSQKINDYFTSVRLSSSSVIGTEAVNWVNISGWHTGDGVQYIYLNGDEYDDIFNAWDWKKLPGTTTADIEIKPLDYQQSIHLKGSCSDYCGGLSNGECGMAAMFLEREHLKAQKAWFMFEKEFVCLGAGIESDVECSIMTTVNQTLFKGEVHTNKGEINNGEFAFNDVKWINHNDITYYFPDKASVNVSIGKKTGNRHNVNRQYRPQKPKTVDMISKDIFCAWIDHGKNVEPQKYSYVVLPNTQTSEIEVSSEIIINSKNVQAVKCNDMLQIVFWEKSCIEIDNILFEASSPCLVMVTDGDIRTSSLYVKNEKVILSINKKRYKAD